MTSKNDVTGQAVKTRKILSPDAKLKAQLKARKDVAEPADQAQQIETASQANVDAIKAVNARARRELGASQKSGSGAGPSATATLRNSVPRNLRVPNAAAKSSPGDAAKKTQAQLAREKLASAAAKKVRMQMEAQARANAAQQSVPQPEQQQSSNLEKRPGNQLIALFPQKKSNSNNKQGLNREAKKPPIINATALLAAKYPNYFADNNDLRTKAESQTVFVISSLILALIGFGWMNWETINLQAEGEFTYNSGLIGGITMLVVLFYALRKRARMMRKAGNMEVWYYFHLLGGVLGPLIIVFHTGFTIKSINSGVALFTMITIVLSGLFGRYIYTRIGYSLHRKLLAIKESEKQLMDMLHSYDSPISENIERRLSNFALSCLTGPRSILKLPMRLIAVRGSAAACYVKVSTDLTAMIKTIAKREGLSSAEVKGRLNREKEQLREHISSVANIAHAHLFERVLVKWRILHIPLLYILVITGSFHVLAVHMY
ncbi:MAG: hypothetical protein L0Z73_14855 [Gammaproteobacteria bacterium]|nr:hypothetical protein [Gammaproteobacteria bacterium]